MPTDPPAAGSIDHVTAQVESLQKQVDELRASTAGAAGTGGATRVVVNDPLSLSVLGPKAMTELIGTLFITLVMGMTLGKSNVVAQAPLAIGGVVVALVYMGGHVSGAHYNPTISVAVWVRGKSKWQEMITYILFQVIGAFVGGGAARAFTGATDFGYPTFHYYWHAAIVEFFWSLLLATVVLNTMSSSSTVNNSYFGLAVGLTVFAGSIVVGPISGGVFNGAIGLALQVIALDAAKCWMYIVLPTAGGVAAGLLFHFTMHGDFKARFKTAATAELVAELLMEMFATFYLALYVALLPYHTNHPLSAMALFGLATALIYTVGPVSGCHMNPAVSIGVYCRFKFGMKPTTRAVFPAYKLILYMFVQCLGALAAAGAGCTLMYTDIVRPTGFPLPPDPSRYGMVTSFFGETLGAFFLVLVILNVATVKVVEGNSYFGVAYAMALTSMSVALGPITGGCFNPAVALLTAVRGAFPAGFSFAPIWVYYVACPLGGALAGVCFRIQNVDDYDELLPAVVAKRYSVMTTGHEEDTRYHKHGRLNDAGEMVKRSTVSQGQAAAKRASAVRQSMNFGYDSDTQVASA